MLLVLFSLNGRNFDILKYKIRVACEPAASLILAQHSTFLSNFLNLLYLVINPLTKLLCCACGGRLLEKSWFYKTAYLAPALCALNKI
jgi:hypothetical protein